MPSAPGSHRRPTLGGKHAPKATHKPRENRDAAHERGYDHRWHKFSRAFRRAHPLCEYCLADGRYVASEVTDHDLPHQGDMDLFWDNTFTALCGACHNGPKASAEARYKGDALTRWIRLRKRRDSQAQP